MLNIDGTSTLDLKGNSPGIFTIYGDVNNSGLMTMKDGAADDVTTISGNYTGVAGSMYEVDTALGNDASLTDMLVINGNTAGTTGLTVTNAGGAGAQTAVGIKVIDVVGDSAATFTLATPAQAGAYEYTLKKDGNGGDAGDWYLTSTYDCTLNGSCPVNPEPPVSVYRPAVALYVAAQAANNDAAFSQMSTLHQRMGEQRDLATDKPQTWGRVMASTVNNDGKNRFDYEQTTTGFQFGHDIFHKTSDIGTQQRAGVTVQYTQSNMDANDRVRPLVGLGEDSGSMKSNSFGLGGYYTRMTTGGAYLDVVGQLNKVSNKFKDSYGGEAKQNGWQLGLSAEVGKPVAEVKGWKIEPQAQLSYLYNKHNGFSDSYSNIDGYNAHQLRGRLGLRVQKNVNNCNHDVQYYALLNLSHDFLKSKDITLRDRNGSGSVRVGESYDRTYAEVGAGIQGQINTNTFIYADARYQRSLRGHKDGASANVGVKFNF